MKIPRLLLCIATAAAAALPLAADEGMWMPQQIPDLAQKLRALGFEGDPAKFADLTGLSQLPPAEVAATARFESGRARVTLRNPSKALAFLLHLAVRKGNGGEEVLPVLWDDNYLTLLPGETREIEAAYAPKDLGGATPVVTVDGWNVAEAVAK